ncbi:SUR7/PalI family-domain-containing protein [Rhexocercosporidium sp. MPI-PUGE-AT-0058]|nr:SUR7/PalI family-domain-containing protein [Rhexocercosporidium sp. MPI-PUGE-AT-0058]
MLVNSLARSLGLHDFYQVGLWNFCEGYNDEGITYCSSPKSLYWFNPVEVLLNELLSGATIALPAEITDILKLIRIASRVMFGFYLTGICMNFLSVFIAPIALKSRWWSLPLTIWTFIAALLTTAATIIASVMAIIFRNVATSQPDLNISASIGEQMFGFMWTGSAFSIFGFLIHLGMTCCCASRRDVRTGRRKGRKSAYGDAGSDEKKRPLNQRQWKKMPKFMRRKTSGEVV